MTALSERLTEAEAAPAKFLPEVDETVRPRPAATKAPDFSAELLITPPRPELLEMFEMTFESTSLRATAPAIATEVLLPPRKLRAPAPLQAPVKFLSREATFISLTLLALRALNEVIVLRLPRLTEALPAPSKVTFGSESLLLTSLVLATLVSGLSFAPVFSAWALSILPLVSLITPLALLKYSVASEMVLRVSSPTYSERLSSIAIPEEVAFSSSALSS